MNSDVIIHVTVFFVSPIEFRNDIFPSDNHHNGSRFEFKRYILMK